LPIVSHSSNACSAARASSGKGGKGGKGGNTDDKDGVELQELSADQQAFLQQVEDRDMQVVCVEIRQFCESKLENSLVCRHRMPNSSWCFKVFANCVKSVKKFTMFVFLGLSFLQITRICQFVALLQEIETQGVILKEIDVKVDKTTKKFVFANRKMKELLEEVCWMSLSVFSGSISID
jgi:hypothetical protein